MKRSFLSRLRLFFVAHTQSSLGDYIGYVALVILATERFHNPTLLSVLLLAEFLPAIFLGTIIGNFVDTYSKRLSAVAADLMRVAAFIGLVVCSSFPLMLGFALLAGFGTALHYSAVQSGLANLAKGRRLHKALSLQSTITSLASVGGPLLGAALLAVLEPELLLLANAVTFLISAGILASLPLDAKKPSPKDLEGLSLIASFRKAVKLPPQFKVLLATTGFIGLFAGMIGIAEVYFALEELGLGNPGLGILIGAYGSGMVLGNIAAMHGRVSAKPENGYLLGALMLAVGLIACAWFTWPVLSIAAFAVAGFGNGLITVSARVLITTVVKPARQGLAYGARTAVESTGLVIALLSAALLVGVFGSRAVLLLAGIGIAVTFLASWTGFRKLADHAN